MTTILDELTTEPFKQSLNQAVTSYRQGDYNMAKLYYVAAFLSAESQNVQEQAYHALHGFTSIIRENHDQVDSEALTILDFISKHNTYPVLYKAEAMWTKALLYWDTCQRSLAMDSYVQTNVMIRRELLREEVTQKLHYTTTFDNNNNVMLSKQTTRSILTQIQRVVNRNIAFIKTNNNMYLKQSHDFIRRNTNERSAYDILYAPNRCVFFRSDGTLQPLTTKTLPVIPTSHPNLALRIFSNDKHCYFCEKTKKQTDNSAFQQCAKCRIAIYCSKDCQINHWNKHKKLCRIKKGHIMILQKIPNETMFNGQLVQIKGKHDDNKWMVSLLVDPVTNLIVNDTQLQHIRSA